MVKTIVDPNMKMVIKKYLDDAAIKDKALASVYDGAKVDECCSFIVDKVREDYIKANGRKDGGLYADPDSIFKMARDFFIDGKAAIKKPDTAETEEESSEAADEIEKATENSVKPEKKKLGELEQLDLFAGMEA